MKLTARLALSQIKINRNRSIMTLIGIALSSAMLTAVCGFVAIAKAKAAIDSSFGHDYNNASFNATIMTIGTVFGSIIIAAFIIVTSNAFRVSAVDRTRQFGILKSVGATKRQITVSVLYEGVFLSMIGIPVGIAIGLIVELISASIVTAFMHTMSSQGALNAHSEAFLTIPFAAPPLMFVIAIVTSFGTVFISAWLPARKAARIPAMDAIRSAGETKLEKRSVRTSKLTYTLFGFEGVLAAKSMKRNRRNFRATVISLTVSIVLLIAAGSFGTMMKRLTDNASLDIDAAIAASMRDMITLIMLFVYVFVGMLALIAITSVISTVNTNIRSRAKEFAVLESVGMTKSGIKRMLNLESVLCSARALIFGLPIVVIGAYVLYKGMGLSTEFPFIFPWLSISECVLGVFAVTWITMRYSAGRLKDGSIVETIKGE